MDDYDVDPLFNEGSIMSICISNEIKFLHFCVQVKHDRGQIVALTFLLSAL